MPMSSDPAPSSMAEKQSPPTSRKRFSLATLLGMTALVALLLAHVNAVRRLEQATAELGKLRRETGYLSESASNEIAAARAPNDEPLTYRARVRIPDLVKYRVAYSSLWPSGASGPQWFAAVDVPPGESVVTVRILEDPRDQTWKITTIVRSELGTKRVATVLPMDHVRVFRGTHDAMSMGIGRETQVAQATESIRLIDERWIVGEGGLLLYGDRSPQQDQIGVYAELQPDDRPL